MTIEERLVPLIRTFLSLPHRDRPIAPDTSLRDLGLDSLGAIDLLLRVEEVFHVTIPDDLLNEKTFGTRRALQRTIEALLRDADG